MVIEFRTAWYGLRHLLNIVAMDARARKFQEMLPHEFQTALNVVNSEPQTKAAWHELGSLLRAMDVEVHKRDLQEALLHEYYVALDVVSREPEQAGASEEFVRLSREAGIRAGIRIAEPRA